MLSHTEGWRRAARGIVLEVKFTNRTLTVGELLNLQVIQRDGQMNLPAVVSLLATRSSLSMGEVLALPITDLNEVVSLLFTSLTETLQLQRLAKSFSELPKL